MGEDFLNSSEFSRRDFLMRSVTGVSAAWLAAQWPEILAAHEHAKQAAATVPPPKLEFFSAPQAADMEAICAAIIPTTDTPGAREAGVVYFIDRGLMTFAKDQRESFIAGLAAVTQVTKKLFPAAASFAALPAVQQVEVLKALEASKPEAMTPEERHRRGAPMPSTSADIDGAQIFGMFRFATILGYFCNPEDGGNRDGVGWKLVDFKPAMAHFPPFGYYDKEYREQQRSAPAGKKP
jgi:gluconate 2-dehydrogenase gamma chain